MASIRKHRDKWQVQVRRTGYPLLSKTFTYQRDAEAWARDSEARIDRGGAVSDVRDLRSITVGDLLRRYRDTVTPRKRGADIEQSRIECFLRLPLAGRSILEATTDRLAIYRDKRLEEVSSATVRKELALLRHVFRTASQEWRIPLAANPIDGLTIPAEGRARERRLMPGELERLTDALKSSRNKLIGVLYQFAIETGMRRGELLKLRWENVEEDRRILSIPEAKNGHPRVIPLTSAALALLSSLRNVGVGTIFPLTPNAVRMAWERLRIRAGLPCLRFHDLRHEAISRFFERGLSIAEVALISGHRDVRMLFRYTHLRAEDVAKKLL